MARKNRSAIRILDSIVDLTKIRRMVHLDFHLNDWVENVCEGFNPESTAHQLKEAGTQMVSIFAKDVYGHSFYPSKYSGMHPHLKIDYVGKMTEALKKVNIPVLLYFSAVYDARGGEEFPDCRWMRTPTKPSWGGWMNKKGTELCFYSPYSDKRVFPQLRELVKNYPIDGFWLDMVGWQGYQPCYCKYCEMDFEKTSGHEIPRDKNSSGWMTYWNWRREKLAEYHKKIRDILDSIHPDLLLASNALYTYACPENSPTYLDMISTDPNADVRRLIFANRYDENQGVPHNFMIERFGQNWGHWSFRESRELKLESACILAHGGAIYFADQPLPSGNLQNGVFPLMNEVFDFVKERERHCIQTELVADIAVLHETNSFFHKYSHLGLQDARADAEGATQILTLLGEQVTVLNEIKLREKINQFSIIVLPDMTILSPATEKAIRDYVKNGGTIIVSGETSLYDPKGHPRDDFGLDDILGVSYIRLCPFKNVFWKKPSRYKEIMDPNLKVINKAINLTKESGQSLRQLLIQTGQVTETDILNATAEKLGMKIIDLDKVQIDNETISLVPGKVAKHYHIIPIDCDKDFITLAISNPFNVEMADELKIMLDREIKMVIAKEEQIGKAIKKYYGIELEDISGQPEIIERKVTELKVPNTISYPVLESRTYRFEELEPLSNIQYQIASPTHYVRPTTAQVIVWMIHPIEESKDQFYTVCGYAPPGEENGYPAITMNYYKKGKAIYISSSIFRDYVKTSDSQLIHWMDFLIQLVRENKKPLLKIDTESNLEISVAQRGKEIFIHLINMNIDRRDPSMHGLSKMTSARLTILDLECPSEPKEVLLHPGGNTLNHEWENGRLKISVRRIDLYSIIQIIF